MFWKLGRGVMRNVKAAPRIRKSVVRERLTLERLEDRSLLAVVADLVAYRPVTEHIDYTRFPVAESVEADPKLGPGIRINGDDDNGNGVADYLDKSLLAKADNDLVRVDVGGAGELFTLSWTGSLAVWTTATKGREIDNNDPVVPGQTVWVEYVGLQHTTGTEARLSLTTSTGLDAAYDSVVFHTFQSVVIAIGGNTQDPAKFGDPNLGTFTMAGTLYNRGYDVHLFSHDQVQSSGQGAAFNEVKSAVLTRKVGDVAIFGYSWGAGATYELAQGLRNDTQLIGQFQLKYTAYVDGIRHYALSAERRLPVGTSYHDNIYQRKDWLLRGDSVTGANNVNNVNVTQTSWGKNLVHTTIDDHATVQGILANNLTTRVVA